ncbi:MAG: hypothetical protein ACTSVZ_11710 [Promethearchaeota archaeon]
MGNDAGEQAIEFFIKRGQLSADTADHHYRDREYSKSAILYKEAYVFFLKAKRNRPDDASILEKLNSIKTKYQDSTIKAKEAK